MRYHACIPGEPASKANSRKIVRFGARLASIKSDKARAYAYHFATAAPVIEPLIEGSVAVSITIFYASRRPDLDESLILDLLQGRAYLNDRQVREKHIYWGLDPDRPRCEIVVEARPALDPASPAGSGRRNRTGKTRSGTVAKQQPSKVSRL